jgi:hypothetical protein
MSGRAAVLSMKFFWATTKAVAIRRISMATTSELDLSLDFNIEFVSLDGSHLGAMLGRIN